MIGFLSFLFASPIFAVRLLDHRLQRQSIRSVGPQPQPPALAGIWKLKRNHLRRNFRSDRYYDVVQVDQAGKEFEMFPLSDCLEIGQLSLNLTKMTCDRVMKLTLDDQGDGTAKIWRAREGGLQSIGGPGKSVISSTLSKNEHNLRENLVWEDGKTWVPVDRPPFLLDFWDDGECMALEGPGMAEDPFEYEVYFGASASLSFKNVPGVTADNFNCMKIGWLAEHKHRFECILRKSMAHYNASSDGSSAMLSTALEHLTQLLSPDAGISGCVPTVCFGLSFPTWPIPSPVPTLSLFLTWPTNYNECNGVSLDAAVAEVKSHIREEVQIEDEVQKAQLQHQHLGGWAHGMSFTLFPVPEAAYFAMGVASLTNTYRRFISKGNAPHVEETAHRCPDTKRMDELIKQSMATCRPIKRRFDLRAQDESLFVGAQSEMHKRRLIAASFPELGKSHHSKPHKHGIGWGAGTYGQLGWTGVAGGIFGGGHFKIRSLYNNYQGCHEWKTVIQMWHNNPLFDLDPDQVLEILPDCIMDAEE